MRGCGRWSTKRLQTDDLLHTFKIGRDRSLTHVCESGENSDRKGSAPGLARERCREEALC